MSNRKKAVSNAIDLVLSVSGALIAVGVTILGIASAFFPAKTAWTTDIPYPAIAVAILGLLLTYVIVERRTIVQASLERLTGATEQVQLSVDNTHAEFSVATSRLISSISGVETIGFDDPLKLKRFLNDRTALAKSEVLDFTWAHPSQSTQPRSPAQDAEFKILEEEHSRIVSEVALRCTYKEIFVLSRRSRIEKLKRRASEARPGYYCKVIPETYLPRLQYVVVDRVEAMFVSANHKSLFSLKHPAVLTILSDYFDEVWDHPEGTHLVKHSEAGAVWDNELYER